MIAVHSPLATLGIRAATPFALVVATYLLFAGHNRPGGGFSAGLVVGAVVALRTIAGLQRPTDAFRLLIVGIVTVVAVAVAPMLWGDPLLDQAIVSRELPLLGKAKTGSALIFDVGVLAIVVGLVVAVLEGMGATELNENRRRSDR